MNKTRKEEALVELAGKALQGLMSTESFWDMFFAPMAKQHPELDMRDGAVTFSIYMADRMLHFIEQYPIMEEGGSHE